METDRRRLPGLVLAAVLAAAATVVGAALLVAASGLYDVAASRPHWTVTELFIEFALRRSVSTHSLGITPPPLDDPPRIALGLRHYEGACQPCHGAPGVPNNLIADQMLPRPPYLPDAVSSWRPAELFRIVKHGLKYTGMPAWPSLRRDDEVWAMVAALQRLPEMDATAYRQAVRGELSFGEESAALLVRAGPVGGNLVACARCHGLDGGGGGAFPRLAGQSEAYLAAALQAYAAGQRPSGVMQPVMSGLGAEDIARLAAYYASAAAAAPSPAPAPDLAARGGAIAAGQFTEIPACVACHGPGDQPHHPLYPALAGQHRPYLEQQLRLFRDGIRSLTPAGEIMTRVSHRLDDADIAAVAAFYAGLPAVRR